MNVRTFKKQLVIGLSILLLFSNLFIFAEDVMVVHADEEENVIQNEDAPGNTEENLLANGGFEQLEESSDWVGNEGPADVVTWSASGSPVFSVDHEVYREGSKSARIDGNPPTASRGSIVHEINNMEINKPYLFSGWVKTEDVSSPIVIRTQHKQNGGVSILTSLLDEQISGTTDWTYFSEVITLPEGTDNPTAPLVKFEAFLENATGTVWFDDFRVREYTPIESMTIDPKIIEIDKGETAQITPEITPSNASNQVLDWSSSNAEAVTVNNDGEVTGVSTGYSVITVESEDLDDVLHAVVTVNPSDTLSAQAHEETVMENGELEGELIVEDTTNAPVELELVVQPKHGIVTLQQDGTYTYYPNRNYSGSDEFMYLASTGVDGPRANIVSITVDSLNNPPVLDLLWYATDKGTTLTGKLANVVSPKDAPLTWSKSTNALHGEVTVNSDGTFDYSPEDDYVGYDSFGVTVTTEAGASTEEEVNIFVVPDESNFAEDLQDASGDNTHPRLLATEDDFANIRSLIDSDPYMTEWFERLEREVEPFMEKGEYNGLGQNELTNTALMFQLTQDTKYADRAIEHLEMMAKDSSFNWPGRYNSMLSLTYISLATGLAYDWLYHEMTPEQRELIQDMVSEHIFSHVLAWHRGEFGIQDSNNINFVNNGSHGLLALALVDEGGQIGDEAVEVLKGSVRSPQKVLRHITEDGVWPEGPGYSNFAFYPFLMMIAGMQSSLGTDYGISDLEGMDQLGHNKLHLQGPGGVFNFADNDNILEAAPQLLWMADFYDIPEYTWDIAELYRNEDIYSPLYLLFYQPGMFDNPPPAELDRTFSGIEAMTMRSDWDNPNGTFAAIKGFNHTLESHMDMDAGTFVFDGLGERWAIDIGNENYSLPGFWDYQNQRWHYYRKNLQGHNSIMINPSRNPIVMQDLDAPALLVDSESKPLGAYGILDMTERYPYDAVDFKRGMMLTGEREQLIIQDEMKLKLPSEIYWSMHTKATIDIIEDGRAAILTQNDKKLYVKMLKAPDSAVFTAMDPEPIPGTPYPDGQNINFGIQKLAVHMTDIEQADLSIWMVPLHEEDPLPETAPAFTPLSEWSIPDGEMPEKPALPTVDSITVDGEMIEDFDPSQTYYEVVLPFEETAVPDVKAEIESNSEISITEATQIPGRTLLYVTDPDNPSVKNRYTVSFVRGPIVGDPPDVNRLPVMDVIASSSPEANVGYTPEKTLDGDLETRWTSQGANWIEYDLGEEKEVGAVSIAYGSGDVRNAYFTITTSLDGESWEKVYPQGTKYGESSGQTTEPEVFHFDSTEARYVRIDVYGNSTSQWNNLREVGIFRPAPMYMELDVPEEIEVGETGSIAATWIYPDGRSVDVDELNVESGNPDLLKVNKDQEVEGVKPGESTVVVHDPLYGFEAEAIITVIPESIPKELIEELEALVEEANSIDIELFTKETSESLTAAIKDASSVLESENATRAVFEAAITTLQQALEELQITYDGLIHLTEQFVDHNGISNALVSKLESAKAAEEKGNENAKDGALGAYKNQVRAQTGKKIAEDHADTLLRWGRVYKGSVGVYTPVK